MGGSKAMRQAVVIVHGIGEQRPMTTLRAFVAGAFGEDKEALGKFVFSKPDRIDDTLELRRLSASTEERIGPDSPLKEGCETDFYELYWQHLMANTTWSSVWRWVFGLAFRRDLPPRFISARYWLSGFLAAGVAVIVGVGLGLALYLEGSPLWEWVAKTTIFSVSVVGLVGWLVRLILRYRAEEFFLGYVGDAARYLTPAPPNIKARRDIRTAGLTLLRRLHDDELRRYERIILVGHSLGSVIAYDLITWFWQERHHRWDPESCGGKREPVAMHPADLEPGDDDGSPLKKLAADPSSKAFPASQWSLGQELREDHRLPWRITDFVTLGSPLAHAEVLLADSKEVFQEGTRQREFPVCPPRCEDDRDLGHLGRTYEDKKGKHYVHILHHGAPFAVTRWTNLYFPRDIIGGPVVPLFGEGIRDVELCPSFTGWTDRVLPALSHTHYWDPSAGNASEELCKALRLNDPEGVSEERVQDPRREPPGPLSCHP
jgi:hypothetical protein